MRSGGDSGPEESEKTETTSPRVKVFTCSWGQLEGAGSNLGDRVILESQIRDLLECNRAFEIGVASAAPHYTRKTLGIRPFSTAGGRVRALLRGIAWADVVVVGGGELIQDTSSLLYSPFNLFPVLASALRGKPSFAWAIGVGQAEELREWTRLLAGMVLRRAAGLTVRDAPSRQTLLELGVPAKNVWKTADCAFRYSDRFVAGEDRADSSLLAVAPRNTSARQGRLLPIETRKRLGLHREADPLPRRRAWATLLDRHIERWGGRVRFVPFHTGSLSSSDHVECSEIASLMRHSGSTEIVDTGHMTMDSVLDAFSECRVTLGVPLHAAVLAVVTGSLPVSLPYASKGHRFMSEVGLSQLCADSGRIESEDDVDRVVAMLDSAWSDETGSRSRSIRARERLAKESARNLELFRKACSV